MNQQILRALAVLASQVKQDSVKLATRSPHKITDDNQSIRFGAINEADTVGVRGSGTTRAKRNRSSKPKR